MHQGEIWVEDETSEESKAKVNVFLQEKLGLETKSLLREHIGSERKKRKKKTIIAKFLNYKHRENVLNKCEKLEL